MIEIDAVPRVIALTTLKGGSGKTTLAACLADYWLHCGESPALVDADPQESIRHWREAGGPLAAMTVVGDTSAEVAAQITRLAERHRPVVVDTAGFRHNATRDALSVADVAVIPVKPSPIDVAVALETRCLIGETRRNAPPMVVRFVLTMTTPGSVITRHIRAQMMDAGLPLFETEIANRVAYAEAALSGATPTTTEPRGAAAREIAALAGEIEALRRLLGAEPTGVSDGQ